MRCLSDSTPGSTGVASTSSAWYFLSNSSPSVRAASLRCNRDAPTPATISRATPTINPDTNDLDISTSLIGCGDSAGTGGYEDSATYITLTKHRQQNNIYHIRGYL